MYSCLDIVPGASCRLWSLHFLVCPWQLLWTHRIRDHVRLDRLQEQRDHLASLGRHHLRGEHAVRLAEEQLHPVHLHLVLSS